MTELNQRKTRRSSKASSKRVRRSEKNEFVPDVAEVLPETFRGSAASQPVPEKKSRKSSSQNVSTEESTTKHRKRKSRHEDQHEVKTVEEVAVPVSEDLTLLAPTSSRRRVIEREELEELFDSFIQLINNELDTTREDKNRKISVRTWSTLIKEAKKLRTTSLKAMKKPKKRGTNVRSGFMKPVAISNEMSSFAGWNSDELKSRVDVTKYLCNYISEHNLQNPEDRRQILADEKLSALLGYDRETDGKPLTYYYLQNKIQPHFQSSKSE